MLFVGLWLAYGLFYQGGGWNQNARFAQVRAVVEEGRLRVDDYLVYFGPTFTGSDWLLQRAPIVDGAFRIGSQRFALSWETEGGPRVALGGTPSATTRLVVPREVAVSGDLSFHDGALFPNKAPGVLLPAVAAYLPIHLVEGWLGQSSDRWWILTVNAWLTTALSISLWAALGAVCFYRLLRRLWGEGPLPCLASALIFGLGTLYFPCATLLQEQALAGTALVMAFLAVAPSDGSGSPSASRFVLAGALTAFASGTSYVAALSAACLGVYLAARYRRLGRWLLFVLAFGVGLVPVLVYQAECFGTPVATAYSRQDPAFASSGALLGVLQAPRLDHMLMLLVSPFRGLFFNSPVLLAGVAGLVWAWRWRRRRPELLLSGSIFCSLLLFNSAFNGWHGGWTTGPRYLVPGIAFLALGLPLAFRRWPLATTSLGVFSLAMHLLITAVDPQPPLGIGASQDPLWRRSPVAEHVLPLFVGRTPPGPWAAHYTERSSVNPMGITDAWFGHLFPSGSNEARWSSFNAGEFLFPGSRWSLVVVALLAGTPLSCAAVLARRAGRRGAPLSEDERLPGDASGSSGTRAV
jgi:hypothetical protein